MNTRGWGVSSLAVGAAVALFGCHSVDSKVKKGQVENTIDQAPVASSYIESIGIGASDPKLANDTQRKALSRDAAIVKAQYEMLSMVKGVQLEGGVTVQQSMESDSTLEAKLKDVIKGAEILKSEFTADDGCVVTIRLPKKRLEEMMGVKFK